jgi:hypothetical protein
MDCRSGANGSGDGQPFRFSNSNNPGVTVIADGDRRTITVEDKSKIVLVLDDVADIARELVGRCGGNVQAAHDAITRVANETKYPRGKPKMDGTRGLLVAAYMRLHIPRSGRSDSEALRNAATMMNGKDAATKVVRRLREQLAKRTLEEFAQSPEAQAAGGLEAAGEFVRMCAAHAAGRLNVEAYLDAMRITLGARPL